MYEYEPLDYSEIYSPMDLVVDVAYTFIITALLTPFILSTFALAYANTTLGKEVLEGIK